MDLRTETRDAYRLEIPADARFLTTARLFAAAIARQSCDEDVVDDVKLGVTEAVSALLSASGGDGPVFISAHPEPGELRFAVGRAGAAVGMQPGPDPSGPVTGLALARRVLPSLAVDGAGAETTIWFSVRSTGL